MASKPFVVHEDDCPIEGWDDVAGVRWRTLVSGDRAPTDSLTVGVTEIGAAPPAPFRLHRHAQAEVYYILAGEGVVTIDDRDYAVRAGSTVFIPGGARHGARSRGPAPLRLLYAFAADGFDDIVYEFPDA